MGFLSCFNRDKNGISAPSPRISSSLPCLSVLRHETRRAEQRAKNRVSEIMSEQPWFKFYAGDYLLDADVDALPREAEALLIRMWCVCHREGSCPSDPEILARKILCTVQYVQQHKKHCDPFFEVRDGKLYSRRMLEEKLRSEKARKNANKRYEQKQSQIPESKSESERGSAGSTANGTANCSAKRAREMPEGFHPTDEHIHLAHDLGVDINAAFPAFVDFHLSKGNTFRDWDRALNSWLRKEKRFGGNHAKSSRKPSISAVIEREQAIARARTS